MRQRVTIGFGADEMEKANEPKDVWFRSEIAEPKKWVWSKGGGRLVSGRYGDDMVGTHM
jgi:hypothetical protein